MLRLLTIEDDPHQAQLLRARLEDQFDVHGAITLARAKQMLLVSRFDVVLIDVGLPDSNREELIESVKVLAQGAALIVLTGFQDTQFMQDALSKSASRYLVKGRDDVSSEVLIGHIQNGIQLSDSTKRLDGLIAEAKRVDSPTLAIPILSWLVPAAAIAFSLAAATASYDPNLAHLYAIDRWIAFIANH